MYLDYRNDIIEYYRAGVRNASVPQRLMQPTPGSIKTECSAVCRTRFDNKDFRVLTAFFEVEYDRDKILLAIKRFDIDRFRPLVNFLKGTTNSTDDLNIELLAWLIDFPQRPFKSEGYKKMTFDTLPSDHSNEVEVEAQADQNNEVEVEAQADQNNEENLTEDPKKQPEAESDLEDARKIERRLLNSRGIIIGVILFLTAIGVFWGIQQAFRSAVPKAITPPDGSSKQTEIPSKVLPAENNSTTESKSKKDRPIQKGDIVVPGPKDTGGESAVNVADYVNQDIPKSDIAILVINQSGSLVMPLSSDIADMYRKNNNYSTVTSLFLPRFSSSTYMERLYHGDAKLIDLLHLPSHADYIVIGKYASEFTSGDFTKYVCTSTLDIVIISCRNKQILNSFSLVASNPYDDKIRAEKGAKEKLLQDFKINHLLL